MIGIISFAIFTCLMSGTLPYYMVGIDSNSMYPCFDKGDAVIVHKVKKNTEFRDGDVVAFRDDDNIIVHRIVYIQEDEDGNIIYRTRGDNNEIVDKVELKSGDIIGTVEFIIPKIVYPAIYIHDLIERNL